MKRYALLLPQFLFFLNGIIWLILSVWMLMDAVDGVVGMFGPWLLAVMMAGNGMIFIAFSLLVRFGWRWFFYAALSFLAANILLTFTDQFGIWDLLTLLVNIAIVALLVINRKVFLSKGETRSR